MTSPHAGSAEDVTARRGRALPPAPSRLNSQPWRFVLVESRATIDAVAAISGASTTTAMSDGTFFERHRRSFRFSRAETARRRAGMLFDRLPAPLRPSASQVFTPRGQRMIDPLRVPQSLGEEDRRVVAGSPLLLGVMLDRGEHRPGEPSSSSSPFSTGAAVEDLWLATGTIGTGVQFVPFPMEVPGQWDRIVSLLQVPDDLELMAVHRLGCVPEEQRRPVIDWISHERRLPSQHVVRETCATPRSRAGTSRRRAEPSAGRRLRRGRGRRTTGGAAAVPGAPGGASHPGSASIGAVRITSLNLRGLFDWDRRMPDVVDALRELAPDVILFQEDVYLPEVSPFTPVALLNRELGLPHRHEAVTRLQQGRVHTAYREGLGLLSRHPVVATETLALRHEQDDPHRRIVQFADVEVDGALWALGNVHLSVRDEFALQHLGELLSILRARDDQRILGGDFNVNHLERRRGLWHDSAVLTTEVAEYRSHPSTDENDDYFLVPAAFSIDAVLVSGDGLSDHRAVTVDLTRR